MKKEFNYNRYLKNNRLLKEGTDMEEANYGSYGGEYASRYDRDIDSSPIMAKAVKLPPVDYRKLGEILMLAAKYEMFEKGQIKRYLKGVQKIEKMIAGGPEKFNPEKAMSLERDEFGLENAYNTPGWQKFDDAMNYSPAAYEGDYEVLAYWLKSLNRAVASFNPTRAKAPANDYMEEGWREDAGIYPTKSWKDIDAEMDAEREERMNSPVVKKAANAIRMIVSRPFSAAKLEKLLRVARLTPLEFEQAAEMGGLELDTIQYMDDQSADYEVLNQNYTDQGAAIAFEGGKFHSIG
jgi:hypothetical protein